MSSSANSVSLSAIYREVRAELARRRWQEQFDLYTSGRQVFGAAGAKHLAFHQAPHVGRVLVGSNKSAKTVTGGVESYWWLTDTHPFRNTPAPPVKGRCVCPELPGSFDKAHPQRDTFFEWCPPEQLRGGNKNEAYNATAHTIHFANGSWLEFKSSEQDPDAHAGENLHFVWLDEEAPRIIYTENMARLASRGVLGHWWWTYTPILGLQWMEDEIYAPGLAAGWLWVVDIMENAHNLPPGFIKGFAASLRDEEKAPRLHGLYGRRSGLVYDIFSPTNVIDAQIEVTRESP